MGYAAWIKLEHTTPDKQELYRMSEMLNLDVDAIFGKVMRFWIWADQNTDNGHISVTTLSQVDRVTFCPGFGAAMVKVGWLTVEDGELVIPNFDRHNSETAKKRANNLHRKRMSRLRHTSVTKMSQDEEEKNVTPSLSLSMSLSESSSEGGGGETTKPEYFEAPPEVRRDREEVSFDHLRDYETTVAEPARHFWQCYCVEHHGGNPMRSLHLDSTRKELRHFAGSIAKHGKKAIDALETYYHSPPKEDKGLSAYAVLCKLGISASVDVEPPWESAKKKAKAEAKEKLRRAIRGEAV